MKKMLVMSLALTLFSTTFFTSCSESEGAQATLSEQLQSDQSFTDAAVASVELFVTAQSNNWLDNSSAIAELMRKAHTVGLTAEEEARLAAMLGMSREDFIREMTDFGVAMNSLLEKYPQLQDMDASERQALFAEVIAGNEALGAYMADLQSMLRACPLQDLCNLVVDLAVIIGGPILCDIIAGAIPIIGPLLCNIAIDLATDILVGICNALPC